MKKLCDTNFFNDYSPEGKREAHKVYFTFSRRLQTVPQSGCHDGRFA
jgi:hypothetical protein